ncbi:hypothetical protein [Ramlibacter sp.]|uniref:hypothetical protein n=1 Tax=Ramlibacter sp. TaxID=1917967 RepID=UPI003D0BA602
MKPKIAMTILAAALLAAGCGSGGGDDGVATVPPTTTPPTTTPPTATTDVPASAMASVDGFIAYLRQVLASSNEVSEPLLVGTAVAPTDETSEPAP